MPGEEAGGALGSFGDILDSGEVPALTLGLSEVPALTLGLSAGISALTLGRVLAAGSGDAAGGGSASGDGTDDSGSAPALTLGLWARDCCNSRRAA